MLSIQAKDIIKNELGFRNNSVGYGRSYPALEVLEFECKELYNEDIPFTLYDQELISEPTYEASVDFIEGMQQVLGKTLYAFWLCASEEDVKKYYPDEYGYEYEDNIISSVDIYSLPRWHMVLSDLGVEGVLFLSKTPLEKNYIKTIYYEEE
jgi:hypothetical protein